MDGFMEELNSKSCLGILRERISLEQELTNILFKIINKQTNSKYFGNCGQILSVTMD